MESAVKSPLASRQSPVHLAFLGCGAITEWHSRYLKSFRGDIALSYASREGAKAEAYCRRHGGVGSYASYASALADPRIDAVLVAVPPRFHLELTLAALVSGKHVIVEKPAFLTMEEYRRAAEARDRAGRVVLVGENDHYKPLAVCLRRLLAGGAIGEMVFAHFTTLVKKLKTSNDWRNDEAMAGGDAFFEEGIHWLHIAGSLGPRIVPDSVRGYRPAASRSEMHSSDRRAKSMMVAFRYDNGAVGSLYYSREVPSLFRGVRISKLFGRDGIITFESNGVFVFARGRTVPRLFVPGLRDIRGFRAMYRDFLGAIRDGRAPEMSLERAMDDQQLMDKVYQNVEHAGL